MVTQAEVLELVRAGVGYEDIGGRLGIHPGLAFMIATGLPADGSDGLSPEDTRRPGFLATSTAHLANPAPVHNPAHHDEVRRWIEVRVSADEPMRRAGERHWPVPPPLGETGDDADVLAVIARDHAHLHTLASQLQVIPTAAAGATEKQVRRRVAVVAALRTALTRHEQAERAYLWPFVRAQFRNGRDVAGEGEMQEQQVHETFRALAEVPPGGDEFERLVTTLERQLRAHVAFEDGVGLGLRSTTDGGTRAQLGSRVASAERDGDGPR